MDSIELGVAGHLAHAADHCLAEGGLGRVPLLADHVLLGYQAGEASVAGPDQRGWYVLDGAAGQAGIALAGGLVRADSAISPAAVEPGPP